MLAAQEHARAVHKRLRNPHNAVPDTGIELKPKLVVVEKPVIVPIEEQAFGPVPLTVDDVAFGPVIECVTVRPSVQQIVNEASRHFKISKTDILSRRRNQKLTKPRHVVMYLCRVLTMHSLPRIGRQLGGREHTSVMHGVRKTQSRILFNDQATINAVDEIMANLGGQQ